MFYEPRLGHGLPHDPFKAIIAPRPIGWISTVDTEGRVNLAPYSFFNAVHSSPPMLAFTSESMKHSAANAIATGEFVYNLCTRPLFDAMNISSGDLAAGESEFVSVCVFCLSPCFAFFNKCTCTPTPPSLSLLHLTPHPHTPITFIRTPCPGRPGRSGRPGRRRPPVRKKGWGGGGGGGMKWTPQAGRAGSLPRLPLPFSLSLPHLLQRDRVLRAVPEGQDADDQQGGGVRAKGGQGGEGGLGRERA